MPSKFTGRPRKFGIKTNGNNGQPENEVQQTPSAHDPNATQNVEDEQEEEAVENADNKPKVVFNADAFEEKEFLQALKKAFPPGLDEKGNERESPISGSESSHKYSVKYQNGKGDKVQIDFDLNSGTVKASQYDEETLKKIADTCSEGLSKSKNAQEINSDGKKQFRKWVDISKLPEEAKERAHRIFTEKNFVVKGYTPEKTLNKGTQVENGSTEEQQQQNPTTSSVPRAPTTTPTLTRTN